MDNINLYDDFTINTTRSSCKKTHGYINGKINDKPFGHFSTKHVREQSIKKVNSENKR
jgi:hypothetical protein